VGTPKGVVRCVFNGVTAGEFAPVVPADDATDVAYVGEFRHIKGADILIDAIARLRSAGRPVTLTLGGDGEETAALHAQIARLGLAEAVRFIGHVPARHGFSKGRVLVVPSRGDSMPYVVIEAGAAGVPMLASRVGGIPEIFGAGHPGLVPANDVPALADAIAAALDNPAVMRERADQLRQRVLKHFSQQAMVAGVLTAYREVFAKIGCNSAR
jgi:glycosyltransferase involved in cell wall biosynthesis